MRMPEIGARQDGGSFGFARTGITANLVEIDPESAKLAVIYLRGK